MKIEIQSMLQSLTAVAYIETNKIFGDAVGIKSAESFHKIK